MHVANFTQIYPTVTAEYHHYQGPTIFETVLMVVKDKVLVSVPPKLELIVTMAILHFLKLYKSLEVFKIPYFFNLNKKKKMTIV